MLYATIASNLLIGVALTLVLVLSVLKLSKTARDICMMWIVEILKKISDEFFDGPKSQLLSPLKSTKSTNAKRRDRGELIVLEIGVGSGKNFKFYPPGTKLISVDPNSHFKKNFEENKSKFPTVEIERFIYGGGEDIDEVEDESVDIAVSTHVLCCVKDVNKVISQVKRVLVKGGKYYYADHVRAPGGPLLWVQILLEPLWKVVADNCHFTRDVEGAMKEAGFREVVQKTKALPKAPNIFKYHTLGVATK